MIIDEKVNRTVQSLIGEFDIIKDHRNSSNSTGVIEIDANNENVRQDS